MKTIRLQPDNIGLPDLTDQSNQEKWLQSQTKELYKSQGFWLGKDLQKKPVQEEKKDANFEASKLTWLMATNFETQLQVLKIQIVEATT